MLFLPQFATFFVLSSFRVFVIARFLSSSVTFLLKGTDAETQILDRFLRKQLGQRLQ